MSNAALTWAFTLPILGTRKAVLVALADHADDAGDCYPSKDRIALFSGLTDRTIRRALEDLKADGLISVEVGGGRNRTNVYRLAIGKTPALCPNTPAPCPEGPTSETPAERPNTPALCQETPALCHNTPAQRPPNPQEPLKNPQRTPNGSDVDLFDGDPPPVKIVRTKRPADQSAEGAAIWNRVCGGLLPQVGEITDRRKVAFAARLKQLGGGMESWEAICRKVAESDFLSGRAGDFRASFDWVLKPANLTKVKEGNFANRRSVAIKSNGWGPDPEPPRGHW